MRGLQGGRARAETGRKEADKYPRTLSGRCRGSAHRRLALCPDTPGGCNLWYGRYPEQTLFQEHREGTRKQGEVLASAQSGGRCLVRGKNGSDLCLLLRCTFTCGVWKRTRCARLLLSAELPVWWLLLLGNTAGSRGSFQLCPDTQLLGSPKKQKSLLSPVVCLGDLLLSLLLETAVRGTAPPSTFSAWQKDQTGR